ncbi:MAG: hypothetical protein ACOCZQ_01320 [Nanoarchaeota archaeon]
MEKSGSEKTYPSRRRACYQSVTGSGRFLIDTMCSEGSDPSPKGEQAIGL